MRPVAILPLLGLLALAFTIAGHPFSAKSQQEPPQMSDSDRQALERAISRAAETARSGEHVPWRGAGETGGTIIMGKAFSRASRAVCDNCADPCRPLRYSIVTGADLSHFQGIRCRQNGTSSGQWLAEGEDSEVGHLASAAPPEASPVQPASPEAQAPIPETSQPSTADSQPPQPTQPDIPAPASPEPQQTDTALVGEMQQLLAKLRYSSEESSGEFSTATQRALAEFLLDEHSTVPATPGSDSLNLLRAAAMRSARRRACPATPESEGKSFVGCGMLVQAH
jgi:surface antigen